MRPPRNLLNFAQVDVLRRLILMSTLRQQRYALITSSTPNGLQARVNTLLDRWDCEVVGGPVNNNGCLLQAMVFRVPSDALPDESPLCVNNQCSIRDKCLRYREHLEPWRLDNFTSYYGGPHCDQRLLPPS